MIVKILNNREERSWSYFECEIIHSRYGLLKNLTVKGGLGDAVILLNNKPAYKQSENKMNVKVLNLETQKTHLRTIVTDETCYVLNGEGKTIDRI